MKPFMGPQFEDELRGLAEGAAVPFELMRRVHMIPAVNEYSCSGVAIWGRATRTGHLYQIRNLDYTTTAHLQDFRCVVIYIPKDGIPHLNPSFIGSIGCHTGMNLEGITLTEIGDSPASEGPYNMNGLHFMILFRQILYTAKTLDQAVQMIQDTKRIKKYHFVVGDGKIPSAVKMKAWAPNLDIWRDNDPSDEMAPQVFPNIVYHAESRTPTARGHLSQYGHGTYDIDAVIQLSKAIGSLGGNLMNAVYDATEREAWLSYAKGDECAYRRPYVQVKLRDFVPFQPDNPKVKIEKRYPLP
jgi:isopenicillin-N N-acyltransferase like protein